MWQKCGTLDGRLGRVMKLWENGDKAGSRTRKVAGASMDTIQQYEISTIATAKHIR